MAGQPRSHRPVAGRSHRLAVGRFNPIKNSFVAGELSPRMEGRDDLGQYFQAMRQAENGIVLPHGGFMRRSGFRHVAEVKTSTKKVVLRPFEFSTVQAYMVEWGDLYARFYTQEARLEDPPATPVEVVSPFPEADLFAIAGAQSADVEFVGTPNKHPYKLSRTSAVAFSLTRIAWKDGQAPLRASNLDSTHTITVTGSGPYTLTASSVLWDSTEDVGRAVRVAAIPSEGWFEITSVGSTTVATADLKGGSAPAGAKDDWALGLFSDTEGPTAISFHEGRLWYGGARLDPDRIVGSVSDDFENFLPKDDSVSDAVNADKSISRRVVSKTVNGIKWLASGTDVLIIGTSGGEFRMRGENDDILTPQSAQIRPATGRGGRAVTPLLLDSETIFLEKDGRTLREFAFSIENDGFVARPISLLAEHIMDGGVTQMAYQQSPDSVIWLTRADGELIGFTFEREQDVIGAHRHIAGGSFLGGIAQIESVAVISNPAGTETQVWTSVRRTINGVEKRYVEFMEDQFRPKLTAKSTTIDKIAATEPAFFVDSGLSLDLPVTITGITAADPAVVSAAAHGFLDGETVKLRKVVGFNDADGDSLVNQLFSFTVANKNPNDFELEGLDASAATAYITGGTARKEVTTVSGLGHLEGETLQVLADGATLPDVVVASGSVTLAEKASIIHVGLGYITLGETQRFVGGGRVGTDQGQLAHIPQAVLRLLNSLGGRVGVGPNPPLLEDLLFRVGDDPMDAGPPLFTGDQFAILESEWTTAPTIFFQQDLPLPFTVLSIMPRMQSSEDA